MILTVALTDLLWAAVVALLLRVAPTPTTRRLARLMLAYVVIEALFHVPMENMAAEVFRWLS